MRWRLLFKCGESSIPASFAAAKKKFTHLSIVPPDAPALANCSSTMRGVAVVMLKGTPRNGYDFARIVRSNLARSGPSELTSCGKYGEGCPVTEMRPRYRSAPV